MTSFSRAVLSSGNHDLPQADFLPAYRAEGGSGTRCNAHFPRSSPLPADLESNLRSFCLRARWVIQLASDSDPAPNRHPLWADPTLTLLRRLEGRLDAARSSQPGRVHTMDTEAESRKAMLPLSPLFKRGPLGCAALLTLISFRVLLPTRGDVRTVSPVENGRYVGPTKCQDVAVRVLR